MKPGRPKGTTKPESEKRQSITIRLPPDLMAQINGLSRNMKGKFIEQAIRDKF